MFGHGDTFHHTSLDTPDKVDPSELRRVCFIALGSTYYLASASEKEARDMSRLISRNGLARLGADYYDSLSSMFAAEIAEDLHNAYKQVLNVVEHSSQREMEAVLSTLRFAAEKALEEEVRSSTGNLKTLTSTFKNEATKLYGNLCLNFGIKPKAITFTAEEKKLSRIVPVRAETFICPLQTDYLEEKLGEGISSRIRLRGNAAYEALNFVDGKRSVFDIARAVSAEFVPVDIQDVYDFFKILEEAELVKLKII
jgi:hypothetical protein